MTEGAEEKTRLSTSLAYSMTALTKSRMSRLCRFFPLALAMLLLGCASTARSPFAPRSGPPTVGMPASLSDRERLFIPEIEDTLRDHGLLPVRHGAGDMQLEFTMSAGPVNTNTRITLIEGQRTVARGIGRAAGLPLIGRSQVAGNSFSRAFEQFQAELGIESSDRGWTPIR